MKRKAGGYDLPEELVEQILSKLPTKSLRRFRAVCKSWNFLITRHLQNISKTADQEDRLREHVAGLRWDAPPAAAAADNGVESLVCSLCGMGRLLLAPLPRYCSGCARKIKYNVNYYRTNAASTSSTAPFEHSFCFSCYQQPRRIAIPVFGGTTKFLKKDLLVAKNVQEIEESWVECETCSVRNHVICGLHNDLEEKRYRCPECRLATMENDDPPRASDLPETVMGSFIQEQLEKRLREDKEERARAEGREVAGAEDLVVRVVMSSKNTLPVNRSLISILRDEGYPAELPYTSKMVMLFQKVDGIDVCIFTMYVHEYGSDCPAPNHRYACISYIDSAKYFTPNIPSASPGEPLRTLAYHQILISYMEYVKRRGFARCYLWSCPPLKGDQYILNCHPQAQKTPNSERLRHWYFRVLKKAAQAGTVVNTTTLYERFFLPSGSPVSAARLPYFDGDYWPTMVDPILKEIHDQAEDRARKGIYKTVTHTSMKVLGITDPSLATNNHVLFMQKLGHALSSSKENFMVIDLHHSCSHCHEPILSGNRFLWKNSYLCQRCHDSHNRDSVSSYEVVDDVVHETTDVDGTLENEICENRYKFLKFCEDRHYQFDTLRRTKYSSVMILRHILYGPRKDVAPSQNEVRSCTSEGGGDEGQIQSWELVEILGHVSKCEFSCELYGCREMHSMLNHFSCCKAQAVGGCICCARVWYTLRCHSKACSQPDCQIPYCTLLKNQAESETDA